MTLTALSSQELTKQLVAYLPTGWWDLISVSTAGTLDNAVMKAFSGNDADLTGGDRHLHKMLRAVERSTYIVTAEGAEIDDIVYDYFGAGLSRYPGETDAQLKARFVVSIFSNGCTRAGMIELLTSRLGSVPTVYENVEATQTGGYMGADLDQIDTMGSGGLAADPFVAPNGYYAYDEAGCYAQPGAGFDFSKVGPIGYDVAGQWGYNLGAGAENYTAFITVQQPAISSANYMTDEQIYALIEAAKPLGTTMWVKIVPSNTLLLESGGHILLESGGRLLY